MPLPTLASTELVQPTEWLDGVGLHSGTQSSVRVLPGDRGAGIRIRLLDSGTELPASLETVSSTQRCTILSAGGHSISTIEHVMSAIAGLQIWDAIIEVRGSEMPIADGSSLPFVALITAAGLHVSECQKSPIQLKKSLYFEDGRGSCITALPHHTFEACVILDYPKVPFIQTQVAEFTNTCDYAVAVAPARTYGFMSELSWLREHGLALGAAMDNVVAIDTDRYLTDLRFENELARHKLLDLIGDLSLLGKHLCAKVVAIKPSHSINVSLAKLIHEAV